MLGSGVTAGCWAVLLPAPQPDGTASPAVSLSESPCSKCTRDGRAARLGVQGHMCEQTRLLERALLAAKYHTPHTRIPGAGTRSGNIYPLGDEVINGDICSSDLCNPSQIKSIPRSQTEIPS